MGRVQIEPVDVNLGLDRSEVMGTLEISRTTAPSSPRSIAPWTAPPAGAIDLLAAHGLPVVSLSWAWGPPRTETGSGLAGGGAGTGGRAPAVDGRCGPRGRDRVPRR